MAISGLPHFIPISNHWYNVSIHSYCPDCYSTNFEFDKVDLNVTCKCGWFGSRFDMLQCTASEYNEKYLKKYLRRKKLERILNPE